MKIIYPVEIYHSKKNALSDFISERKQVSYHEAHQGNENLLYQEMTSTGLSWYGTNAGMCFERQKIPKTNCLFPAQTSVAVRTHNL